MTGNLGGKVAVVTGAGSGVGRAAVQVLAEEGAAVVLAGRTSSSLQETRAMVHRSLGDSEVVLVDVTCDVSDLEQVRAMIGLVLQRFGRLDILVNNAGVNIPNRALSELTPENWRHLVEVDLNGAYWCIHEALPVMRRQGSGTVINIGSNASRRPSTLPGAAYTAAKAGLWGLSAVINAEERRHGIRSSIIIPGDVNTPLLDDRPHPPSSESRERAAQPEDVAECIRLIATLPARVNVEELVLLPTS